tara:strand:- start:421 stop:987 length:567 start_codon:yes stop_codon:yes gene_type:complete
MNVLEFLLTIDNVLPDDTCDKLIKLFEDSEHKQRLDRGGYPNWTNLFIGNHYPHVEDLLRETYTKVARSYQRYTGEYGLNFNTRNFSFEGSNIKKYVGGSNDVYKRHADVAGLACSRRFVAMLFYLNDDFEGGETIFYPDHVIKPKKGSVLVFPPFWCFPHEGTPVIKGNKYIMSDYCLWDKDYVTPN